MRAVAYTRVSTSEQADSGAGLDVQIAAIELDCRRRDATIVERFEDAGFSAKNLKRPGIQQALDLGVDTTTPSGEMMANVLATFAQFERRLIGQRTKDALAIKRAQGVKLGRPRAVPGEIIDQIVAMRASGTTFAAIATQLNECQVPTGHGGACWHASTVHALLRTLA